jgi:hypothetical protein
MDLSALMKQYAEQIGGQYTENNDGQSIVIVPVSGGRFQTVVGKVRKNDLYNRKLTTLTSKVCPAKPTLDYRMLLEQTAFFNYCRFVIRENYLQVEAVAGLENIADGQIREMIEEVANLADQYELKLTGVDVH